MKLPDHLIELVVVDNGSSDATRDVVNRFNANIKLTVHYVFEGRQGLGHARNRGIEHSSGELLVFSDDDCYFDKEYFWQLSKLFNLQKYGYGGGQILLVNPDDDDRVANLKLQTVRNIAPYSYCLQPGLIQGANLIFSRQVFTVAGLFRDDMGAGTPFPCEDIEIACRASNHGFAGVLFPELIVYHDHGKNRNSPDALATLLEYDRGRGAYYASLLCEGRVDVFDNWLRKIRSTDKLSDRELKQLAREFRSAADFIDSRGFLRDLSVVPQKKSL
jgi:glycosyltransferase involved in cell wall biosynthesis